MKHIKPYYIALLIAAIICSMFSYWLLVPLFIIALYYHSLRGFFKHKRIMHTENGPGGEFVKRIRHNGKRYVRVAYTNQVNRKGVPVTDIPVEIISHMRVMPSKFDKWMFWVFNTRPRPRIVHFKKNQK